MPTRVLDVGNAGDDLVRLHISSGGDTSDYITLSYCWGRSGNPIVTTADNLAMHIQDGIRVSALPATLRQAVELTRLLGIKYIWIDALCIIQHDVEDWTRESALMSSVYSQSLLTIAAAGAVDVKEGLFLKRSERHGSSVQLPWPEGQSDHGAGPVMLHITPSFRLFQVEIPQTPLSSRGWTFQERALSARVLHFTNEMCYWECKQSRIGEDDAHGRYSVLDEFYHLHGLLLPPSVEGLLTRGLMHEKWAWVVEEYSCRQLTNANDIFPALEGLAIVFAEKRMIGEYYCGLWQDELPRQLLWYSRRGISCHGSKEVSHRRTETYRAPTLS